MPRHPKFEDCVKSAKMRNNTQPARKKVNPFAVCHAKLKNGPQNGRVIKQDK